VITCTGRIVVGEESEALQRCLDETLPLSMHVLLHLEGVDFIDSGGLGMLARYLTRAQNAGGALKLCALSRKVDDVLKTTRLKAVFQIYDTEADSIADVHGARDRESSIGRPDILCVDPSLDVLAYLGVLLKQSGYRILSASNLPDALILLKTTRPKVVVLGPELRAGATGTAQEFNRIANRGAVVELPPGFSSIDAGDAAVRLLESIRVLVAIR
jgi:anti-anti-sigma factor